MTLPPKDPIRVLVASQSAKAASRLEQLLASHESVQVHPQVATTTDVMRSAKEAPFEVLVSDLDLTGFESIQHQKTVSVNGREVRRIIVKDPRTGVEGFHAVQIGVSDFQVKPFSRDEFLAVVRAALRD